MARNYKELQERMDPASRAENRQRVQNELQHIALDELRNAKEQQADKAEMLDVPQSSVCPIHPGMDHRLSVFVIMPFSEEFQPFYEDGIRLVCAEEGVDCARTDDQRSLETILQPIVCQIKMADVVVAEMTGRNPNVYYEVGLAHGMGKRVILLTERAEDIPFNLKRYTHIVHGGDVDTVKRELKQWIGWCKDNPGELLSP